MSQQEKKDMAKHFYRASAADFMKIPGSPVAYWASEDIINNFVHSDSIIDIGEPKKGLITADNDRFMRLWYEVSWSNLGLGIGSSKDAYKSEKKWFPIDKGGKYRKWYGNNEYVVNWEHDGYEMREWERYLQEETNAGGRIVNEEYYFREGATWSAISSGNLSVRFSEQGALFSNAGLKLFCTDRECLNSILGILNSYVSTVFLDCISQTMNFEKGNVERIPFKKAEGVSEIVNKLVNIHKDDWDSYETSFGFKKPLFISGEEGVGRIRSAFEKVIIRTHSEVSEAFGLEELLNEKVFFSYGLERGAEHVIRKENVTLSRNACYRLARELTCEESRIFGISEMSKELASYAVGSMMGRFSLGKSNLILASQGETLQDYLAQIPTPSFAPDENAILPLTDQEWFPDDATNRFREFIRVVWGNEHLQENLDFVAESLCLHAIKSKRGESALDTIRRYLSTQFFKDHLRTYKKRPIYWLFSSGKHKAFECLVYLHRYNESTLARMRTEYVIPLSAKLSAYADKLEQDKDASTSTAETKRLEKEVATLHKQQIELAEFDEKLRHYADQRISLNLDDGVKINYGKFGNLLAETKAVTGNKEALL